MCDKCDKSLADYKAKEQPLFWDGFENKRKALWDAFKAQEKALRDEYESKREPLWNEYQANVKANHP